MAEILLPLTSSLNGIINDVGTAENTEILHQCRTTTQQLRIALTLFEPCFSHKKIKFWEPVLKNLTNSLSEPRDLDVQIAYIESLLEHNTQTSPNYSCLGPQQY